MKARVFTDRWPHCSCVVVLYQEWTSRDPDNGRLTIILAVYNYSNLLCDTYIVVYIGCNNVESFCVAGNTYQIVRVLQQHGVLDWTITTTSTGARYYNLQSCQEPIY